MVIDIPKLTYVNLLSYTNLLLVECKMNQNLKRKYHVQNDAKLKSTNSERVDS